MTRQRPRRTRETPLAWVGLGLGVVFVLAAAGQLLTDAGTWSGVRLAVAVVYLAYAGWFLRRARRRDRLRESAERRAD